MYVRYMKLKKLFILSVLPFALVGCQKESHFNYPSVYSYDYEYYATTAEDVNYSFIRLFDYDLLYWFTDMILYCHSENEFLIHINASLFDTSGNIYYPSLENYQGTTIDNIYIDSFIPTGIYEKVNTNGYRDSETLELERIEFIYSEGEELMLYYLDELKFYYEDKNTVWIEINDTCFPLDSYDKITNREKALL